jgi:hypothetical protein
MKDFDRMAFKDETDFEAYKVELTADVTAIKQELADAGLSKFKVPGGGDPAKTAEDDFVQAMTEINKQNEKND